MAKVQFNCPECLKMIDGPLEQMGHVINCPTCKKAVRIPMPPRETQTVPQKASSLFTKRRTFPVLWRPFSLFNRLDAVGSGIAVSVCVFFAFVTFAAPMNYKGYGTTVSPLWVHHYGDFVGLNNTILLVELLAAVGVGLMVWSFRRHSVPREGQTNDRSEDKPLLETQVPVDSTQVVTAPLLPAKPLSRKKSRFRRSVVVAVLFFVILCATFAVVVEFLGWGKFSSQKQEVARTPSLAPLPPSPPLPPVLPERPFEPWEATVQVPARSVQKQEAENPCFKEALLSEKTLLLSAAKIGNWRGVYEVLAKAQSGDASAMCVLGWIYFEGKSGYSFCFDMKDQDYAEAFKWWRNAADLGDGRAALYLGYSSAVGKGAPQDYAEAFKWWRKAVDLGYGVAAFNLGCYIANGKGVPQDKAEAFKWWRKAADLGNEFAMFNLGLCYVYGWGVPKDDVHAYMWFNLATATKGDDTSFASSRDSVLARMTSAQVVEAQRLATEVSATKQMKLKDAHAEPSPFVFKSCITMPNGAVKCAFNMCDENKTYFVNEGDPIGDTGFVLAKYVPKTENRPDPTLGMRPVDVSEVKLTRERDNKTFTLRINYSALIEPAP